MSAPAPPAAHPHDASSHPRTYERRRPETTLLYEVVQEHLQTFLAQARDRTAHGFGLPRFVQNEFHHYLDCGQLARGFLRVRCDDCRHERLLAFSCKGRVCPSCATRRMNDVAEHLGDRVLPAVSYRQWTLSLPRPLRFRLAQKPALVSVVLGAFLQVVFAWQRRRARGQGVARGRTGAVTFVQNFSSALQLNIHFHALLPDGVFAPDEDDALAFHELDPPSDAEVGELCDKIVRRVHKHLSRADPGGADWEPDADDALAAAQAESVQAKLPHLADDDFAGARPVRRCALRQGFSLHANVFVHARDRDGLLRLCRYGARPPLALERLTRTDDGVLLYRLKRPARSGARTLSFTPLGLLARLAPLVPRPFARTTRYHGLFSSHAKHRAQVVPSATPPQAPASDPPPPSAAALARAGADRLPWSELLHRVFRIDILRCQPCGGRVRVLACITEPAVVRHILDHLGLPSEPVRAAPARASPPPPQTAWGDGHFVD